MNWDNLAKVLIGLLTVAAAIFKLAELYKARSAKIEEIKRLLEAAEFLPEGNETKEQIRVHAEIKLRQIVIDETTKSRDTSGVILAVLFILGAAVLGYLAVNSSGYWWVLSALLLLLGLTGLSQDAVSRERDAKNRPVKKPRNK